MPSEAKWGISFLAGAVLLWIGWRFFFFLVTIHVIVCLILMGVILLQGGEAADLAGAFGGSGSQTAFGPRAAATFLSHATTWCAVMFMFTTMALTVHVNATTATSGHSVLEQFSKGAPVTAPSKPPNPVLPTVPAPTSVPIPAAPAAAQPAPAVPATPAK